MALLTAGKQISVGGNNTYGRGLFIVDPQQAEKKARKQLSYQEELRSQMQEDRRRKEEKKKKEMEDDMRLERKIEQEKAKQKQTKNVKSPPKNDKNYALPPVKPPANFHQVPKVEYKPPQQQYNYKLRVNVTPEADSRGDNPYTQKSFSLVQAEEERFFEESSNQRLRAMHQVLEEKLGEVYKRIRTSQDLEIDKEIDIIRKKIASSNNTHDTQKYKERELQGEISHFYKIPKKAQNYGGNYGTSRVVNKNLNYDTQTSLKRNDNMLKPVTQDRGEASRQLMSRQSGGSNDDRLWGMKKAKKNFLGNRQAMDYQINSMLGKIDNLLQDNGENER